VAGSASFLRLEMVAREGDSHYRVMEHGSFQVEMASGMAYGFCASIYGLEVPTRVQGCKWSIQYQEKVMHSSDLGNN